MMLEQPTYYAIIPANVRYDNTLKANEKLLYGEITSLCNKEGYCWASNKYFARLYNVSEDTVSKWITSLVRRGYLERKILRDEDTGKVIHRALWISCGYVENHPTKRPSGKKQGKRSDQQGLSSEKPLDPKPLGEKVGYNNTRSNNKYYYNKFHNFKGEFDDYTIDELNNMIKVKR